MTRLKKSALGVLAVASLTAALTVSGSLYAAVPGYRVYVTNELSGDLSVIDSAADKVVATIKLGKRPRGLKISASGKLLFVAMSGSPIVPPGADEKSAPPPDKTADGIGIVDLASLALVRVIRGVSDPEQLALSGDDKHLFVASEDTGKLHVIDIASGKTLATLKVGDEPEGVTLSPNGKLVCVTSEEDSIVSLVDTKSHSIVAAIPVGKRPRYCEFSPDSTRTYVTGEMDASLAAIDVAQRKVIKTIPLPGENVRPMGVDITADGKKLYVATGRGGTLVSIDAKTFAIEQSTPVGPRPWNIALSRDESKLYTANGNSNDVSVVDAKTMKVLTKIPVGERPWGVVVGR